MKGLRFQFVLFPVLLVVAGAVAVQAQSAAQVIQDAVKKSSQPGTNISTVIKEVETAAAKATASNQRSLYSFLGSLTEQLGRYEEAAAWYAKAAGISAAPAPGTSGLTTEQLVLAAVRCSLSCGDNQQADNYLSSIRNSTVEETVAYSRLYGAWSWLCKINSAAELLEPVAVLKSYAAQADMKLVRPPVYLTLWYVTGEETWSKKLQQEFPKSAEAALVTGSAQMLPTPFWFFLPRDERVRAATANAETSTASVVSGTGSSGGTAAQSHVVVRQQVGFFRSRENAENLASRVRAAGFKPDISEEQRQSGTVYFVVTVPEDKDNSTGIRLKTAGFECYPVFADE